MAKDQYVINPLTNKPIMIGGKTYKDLVKQSIIKADDDMPVKPQRKTQLVVKKLKNAEEAKQLKAQLPPAPKGKAYVAIDNTVVMRDKRGKSITPDKYSALFSKASIIVNKKLSTDAEFMNVLNNCGSVDDLPVKYKQKIEQMLMEEVMRIPEKQSKKDAHIVVPDEKTSKSFLKKHTNKKSSNDSDNDMSGYESNYSIMSDDSEMNTIIRNKKKSNNSNNRKKTKQNEPKLIAVIQPKRTHRPTPKTKISSHSESDRTEDDYFGGETSTDDDTEPESDSSSESDA